VLNININLLWTVINILVLCVLVRIFLFKPIHKILDQRQKLVDQDLADAAAAKAEAEALEEEKRSFLADMDAQRAKAVEESTAKAGEVYSQIVASANEKARGIVKNAEVQAERQKEEALRQAQSEIRDLVISATAKVIGAKTEDDGSLYDRFLEEVSTGDDADNS
jgi:F-type H+-transporting ATPase subunit b